MALTEERKRELDAALAVAPSTATEETEEEKLARLNAKAAERGDAPITIEDLTAANQVGVVPEPTTGEKAGHISSRWLSGMTDIADIPYYVDQASGAVGRFIDKKAPGLGKALDAVKEYHPLIRGPQEFSELLPDAVGDLYRGETQATEVIPGLSQARDFLDEQKLSDEQLAEAPVTRAAGVGAEWLGVPGVSALPKVFQKGSQKVAKEIVKREARDAAIMAGGAGGVSGVAGAIDESWGDTGELIGGLAGLAYAIKSGNLAGLSSEQNEILRRLRDVVGDDEAVIAAINKAEKTGEIGTLADILSGAGETSGARAAANVESLVGATRAGDTAFAETAEKRRQQIFDETQKTLATDLPEGSTPELSSANAKVMAGRREDEIAKEGQQRLTQADEAVAAETARLDAEAKDAATLAADSRAAAEQAEDVARTVEGEVTPPGRPSQYGSSARRAVDVEADNFKTTVERPAWKKFDESGDINTTPYRAEVDQYLNSLDPAEADALQAMYGTQLNTILDMQTTATPRALSLAVQKLKNAVEKAGNKGEFGFEETKLKELYQRLEELLVDPINGNPAYREAVAATRQGKKQYGDSYLGEARGTEPEEFFATLGLKGPRGAVAARLIEESKIPGLQELTADSVLADATRRANLDEQFLIEYEDVLVNLDRAGLDTRAKVQALIDSRTTRDSALKQATAAQETAETTTRKAAAEQERLNKAVEAEKGRIETETQGLKEANRQTTAARYGKGYEEADAVVDELLTKPDGADRLTQLFDDMLETDAALGGTRTINSFRARVNDRVSNRLFDMLTDAKKINPRALQEFRQMRRRLVESQLLDAADADYIDDVLRRTETELARAQSSARAARGIESAASEQTNLASSALSAIMLGPLPGGYNLQLGGAVRRALKNELEANPTRKHIEALVEYLNDPQKYLAGIEKLDTPEAQAKFFLTKIMGAAQAAEILGAE